VNISKERLMAEASTTGFRPEMLEKVIRLLDLLDGLRVFITFRIITHTPFPLAIPCNCGLFLSQHDIRLT
jgi:hypothetical protein